MTRKVKGGAAQPITVVSASDLKQNNGRYRLGSKIAVPVVEVSGRGQRGSSSKIAYPVSDADIQSGDYRLLGGSAMPVVVESGDLGGASAVVFVSPGLLRGSGAGSTILLQDTFTDDDATLLENHTPDIDTAGNGWSVVAGNWTISNNKLVEGVNTNAVCRVDVGDADVTITMKMTIGPDNSNRCFSGIGFRIVDDDDMWAFRFSGNITTGEGEWEIREWIPTPTQRASSGSAIVVEDQVYTLKVVCEGQTVVGYVDGDEVCRYESASGNESVTSHGVRHGDSAETTRFDDFTIDSDVFF